MKKKKYKITIFTPTFNRVHLLPRLYNSLLNQHTKEFEWVVVDDGSTDLTYEYILNCIKDDKIDIQYYKQKNSGKHIAINKGVKMAQGELFFIVDSDDFLTKDAISKIIIKYDSIKDNLSFIGVSGRRGIDEKKPIGTNQKYKDIIASPIDFRYKYKIKGDMAEVFKTDILKKNPFPNILNEKFCPESLIWNRVSKNNNILWFSDIIYICEYIEGGLTDNIFEIRKKAPLTTTMYYKELESYNIPLIQKIKANINYWRFSFYLNSSFKDNIIEVNFLFSLLGIPLGFFFHLKDKFQL